MALWLGALTDSNFMPHGHCYLWRPDILWLHVVSDSLIALAYYMIPLVLFIVLIRNKSRIPYPEVLTLFIAFILLCGTTHVLNIVTTWHPLYELEGWIKALTAAVSIFTALALIPRLPTLVRLPAIQEAYNELKQTHEEMAAQTALMTTVYEAAVGREQRIMELKREVNEQLAKQGLPGRYQLDSEKA